MKTEKEYSWNHCLGRDRHGAHRRRPDDRAAPRVPVLGMGHGLHRRGPDGTWVMPDSVEGELPLFYSLRARKPPSGPRSGGRRRSRSRSALREVVGHADAGERQDGAHQQRHVARRAEQDEHVHRRERDRDRARLPAVIDVGPQRDDPAGPHRRRPDPSPRPPRAPTPGCRPRSASPIALTDGAPARCGCSDRNASTMKTNGRRHSPNAISGPASGVAVAVLGCRARRAPPRSPSRRARAAASRA